MMQQKRLAQAVAGCSTHTDGAADCAAEGALIVKAMRFAGLCGDDFMHRDDEVSHWQPYIVPLSPLGE